MYFDMKFYLPSALVAILLLICSTSGHAQNQDSVSFIRHLDKVTVTAQKQSEDLQEVPVAVSSINEDEARRMQLWQTRNLTAFSPNLFLSHSGDGRNVAGIRGVATTSYDPAVAVYVDGVIQFDLDTYINELQDIDRVEILRGPQGTLYGRNAMGGVINILTKEPANKTGGYAGIDFGNYGLQRYSLSVKTPILSNKLFFGLAGRYENDKGYFTNAFNDSDFDKKHHLSGNYYLKYLTDSDWSFTLNYKHQFAKNHGAFTLAGSMDEARENPFVLNQNSLTRMVDDISNASLNIVRSGERIHFTSQTSYQYNYRIYEEPIDGDFSPLDIVSIIKEDDRDWNYVSVWTQELRLSSGVTDPENISWQAGVFGFLKDDPEKQGTHFGENGDLYGAVPHSTIVTTNTGSDKGVAAFGQIRIPLTVRLGLTVGARYDHEVAELTGRSEFTMEGMDPIVTHPDTTGKGTYDAFSPKAALTYQAAPHSLLFLSYSRGFRAGGLTPVGEDPSEPPLRTFEPEFSNNFEAGIKNEFLDQRLRWNFSAFYTRVTDIQISQLIMPEALVVTNNEGKLRSMGLESELSALLGKNFTAAWNAGITDAQFTDLAVAGDGANEDFSGNKQIFTPNFTSNLALQYDRALGASQDFRLSARAEWAVIGKTYFDLANRLSQDPYHLMNLRIGLRKGPVGLALWSKNVFDAQYIDFAYDFGAAHLGDPATYGVSLDYRF